MRKVPFINGQFYHVYNRGVEKRNVFEDKYDFLRFIQSMKVFNTVEPIGSIYAISFNKRNNKKLSNETTKFLKSKKGILKKKLVNFICYRLNSNHYHLLLEQVADNGISEFMKRLGGGYTRYFNEKYKRSGVLFQGVFKSSNINSDEYLKHLSVYINLNDRVHKLSGETTKYSSWEEYVEGNGFCKKDIILGQFDDDRKKYEAFAEESLGWIIENKEKNKKIENTLLE